MAAKRLLGHAVELAHRLPATWAQVRAGRVPAWRARLVAEATIHASPALTVEAAGWVDAQVAPFAARVGVAQLDRAVAEAIRRHGLAPVAPEIAVDEHGNPLDGVPPARDTRQVRIDTDTVSYDGTAWVAGELDLADALDLDHALRMKAATYKALGSELGLDARRAKALGDLARTQTALDLAGAPGTTSPTPIPAWSRSREANHELMDPDAAQRTGVRLPAARALVLHLHFDAAVHHSTGDPDQAAESGASTGLQIDRLGRLEDRQHLVLREQIQSWCGDSLTKITIKPVVRLAEELSVDRYEPTPAQREQVQLRDGTCRFPWCSRPARRCQTDHVTPYDHTAEAEDRPQPGPTTSSNLAALCTHHHRVKTHAPGWRVTMPTPGVLEWTSPHGHRFRVDHTGTTETDHAPIAGPEPPGRP